MDCPPKSPPDRWTSYVIAVAALLLLGGHVLATLVYLSPPNIAKEHLGGVAKNYMKPLFSQNWHLFSPNPGISTRKLAVRCGTGPQGWSEWFDPLEGLTVEHYGNRFSGTGKLLYIYRAVGNDLRAALGKRIHACIKTQDSVDEANENCAPEMLMDTLVETDEFALALEYTLHVCEEYTADDPETLERLQFKLLEFFPVKYEDQDRADESGRRWGKVHEVFFPVIEGE